MVSFLTLKAPEAKAFLASFLEATPQRLDELRQQCATQDGPPPEVLDLTPSSLEPLWSWAQPRFSWREGYQPRPLGEPGPRVHVEVMEPLEELPPWFDPPLLRWSAFCPSSLWLIDGLARYLGQCLLDHVPDARWEVGKARKGYVYQNHPVIVGLPVGDPVQPMWSVSIIAGRALQPSPGPSTLMDAFTAWTDRSGPTQ